MVVQSFQQYPITIAYVLAMIPLCLHLSHGFSSMFQSVGLHHEKFQPCLQRAGKLIALAIFIGYVSIPISCLLGFVKYVPGGVH